jgi:hypothetical protein
MATYMLNPEVPIAVLPGAVEVVLQWPGRGAASLVFTSGGESVDALVWPAHPSRSVAVLTEPETEVTVGVQSPGTFPAGSQAGLTLRIQTPDGSIDEIQVAAVDVSGLDARSLVVLSPGTNRLNVRGVEPVLPMSDVAAAARTSARQLLGVEQVGTPDTPAPLITVDASASMQRLARDGDLEPVLDTIVGVCSVLASTSPRVVLLGDRAEPLDEVAIGDVSRTVVAALGARPALVGFRTSFESVGRAATGRTVFVVTDGIPTDFDSWPEPTHPEQRHLVVVTTEGWMQVTRPGTVVAQGGGRLGSVLVRELLQDVFPVGSPLERRVVG